MFDIFAIKLSNSTKHKLYCQKKSNTTLSYEKKKKGVERSLKSKKIIGAKI